MFPRACSDRGNAVAPAIKYTAAPGCAVVSKQLVRKHPHGRGAVSAPLGGPGKSGRTGDKRTRQPRCARVSTRLVRKHLHCRGNPCGCPFILGRHKACPYGVGAGDDNDPVNMIWHHHERLHHHPCTGICRIPPSITPWPVRLPVQGNSGTRVPDIAPRYPVWEQSRRSVSIRW